MRCIRYNGHKKIRHKKYSMNQYKYGHSSQKHRRLIRFRLKMLIIIALVLCLTIFCAVRIRPIIEATAVERTDAVISNMVYDSALAVLGSRDYSGEYASVKYGKDGSVKSVSCDNVKLNLLMTQINNDVEKRIAHNNCGDVTVHIGTLLGFTSTYGRGPEITYQYDLTTNVNCAVSSKIESAGINQSKLLIILHVSVNAIILIPFHGSYTAKTVNSDFPVSETLVLGDVPQSYTNISLKR